jgi:hypothetical protein
LGDADVTIFAEDRRQANRKRQPAPDHTTIARCRQRHENAIAACSYRLTPIPSASA